MPDGSAYALWTTTGGIADPEDDEATTDQLVDWLGWHPRGLGPGGAVRVAS